MHNRVIFFSLFLTWNTGELNTLIIHMGWGPLPHGRVACHIVLWIIMSEVLFRIFATLNRIVIFMFKIILAIKSSNKSRTLATLTIKLHLVDFHMRSASWKTMDQMQMAMKVFCKTRTRINVRKSTPVLMAKTVTVTVWVPEIFMKSNKTLWASDCVLSKLHRSRAVGFF